MACSLNSSIAGGGRGEWGGEGGAGEGDREYGASSSIVGVFDIESLSGKDFCLDGFFPGRNFLMKGLSNIAATGSYTWRRARGDFNGEIGSLLGDISTLPGVVDEGVGTGDRTAV
jgi:hypothetical protein